MADHAFEKQEQQESGIEMAQLVVEQPKKLEGLLETLDVIDRIAEATGEDRSGDWSGTGGQTGGQQQDDGKTVTALRTRALANLPAQGVMQRKLTGHIKKEIKTLRKQVRHIRRVNTPGGAYKLNKLYERIRRLNGLVTQLIDASYEVVKRMFVRVFIDKQSVISD